MQQNDLETAKRWISESKSIVALTGAGVSVESGIAPFRGKGGIWERYDPEEYASIQSFHQNPEKVWGMLREWAEELLKAEPNPGHYALAELENRRRLSGIITQNIDGLHQKAGNSFVKVIEFHGNYQSVYCVKCRKRKNTREVDMTKLPPRCECGGLLRPSFVFFGEAIPQDTLARSYVLARECDLMLAAGTTAIVMPAAQMPFIVRDAGAKIIEINMEPTVITGNVAHLSIFGKSGEILPQLIS